MNIEVDVIERDFMEALKSYNKLSVKENDTVTIIDKANGLRVNAKVDNVERNTISLKSIR